MYFFDCRQAKRAFTIVELLTVIGLIALLLALLLPALVRSRRNATSVQCINNMRQLTAALIGYAGENGGAFPPNSGEVKKYWYQEQFLGRLLKTNVDSSAGELAYGVVRCPNDLDDSVRSYSMNVFASSDVSRFVRRAVSATQPTKGKLFRLGTSHSSSIIVLVESWPELPWPDQTDLRGHVAQAIVGFVGSPGTRFGGGSGVAWTDPPGATPNRFQPRRSQIAFFRHRDNAADRGRRIEELDGRANFAFADGHVASFSSTELADPVTGKSHYVALWSTIDRELENPATRPATQP